MKTCATCREWNLKGTPSFMARAQFALCNKGPIWSYMPPTGKCNEWRAATPEIVEGRRVWLDRIAAAVNGGGE